MFKIGKYLLGGLSVVAVFLIFFQEKIILHPIKLPQSYKYVFDVPFEERHFEPKAGVRLNGILFRANNSKGLVFYNHGNADNLQRWGRHAEDFTGLGYDVFFYDYRGFGKSKGEFSEQEILNDAIFLFDQLRTDYVDKKVIIYGRSLGTGVATFLAKNRKSEALILETPYYNMADVGKSWLPFVPFKRVLKYKFPTNEWIKDVRVPIIIFHGTNDWVVPYQSGRRLAGVVRSKLVTIEGGGHKNLGEFEMYHVELGKILE